MDMHIAYCANDAPATAEVDFIIQSGSDMILYL
jgi:hypothetical protein